ncbi:hypothetical protein HMPREF3222_02571 [Clostridium perfringens]|uniref:Uncharacterized protein n=1 Tax=Clostridium perfringens TaxID=1502 RepID=A0A133MV92_CLOPF|nr:hypothetical protein HMPREF3222_02571 [Clostridium perfringens]
MNLYMNDIICILKLITRRGDFNLENIKSIFYFLLAGVFEIGGGYFIWLWLREGKSLIYGIIGALALILYGIIPTLQPENSNFGRVYATYGGIFIVLSILWGWKVDNIIPDKFDLIGGFIALIGVLIIMYAPRG